MIEPQWGIFYNDDQQPYFGKMTDYDGNLYYNDVDNCWYEHFEKCSDEHLEIIQMIEHNEEVISYFHKMLFN